ncbi:MAG TPA: hypothetical protein VH042_08035 [Solirubrobacterales bacterium]|jgi:hypothetical protein|nr:hypothetical protein [Solirubrobacterales bacterium]
MKSGQALRLLTVLSLTAVVPLLGCGSSEQATRPLNVAVIKGFLRELPGMHYRFQADKERGGSGAIRGLAFGPADTKAEFEVSFNSNGSPEISLGPYLHSGVGFSYPGGSWGMTWREIDFHRHRPQTGVTSVQRKICKWTTGSLCPI